MRASKEKFEQLQIRNELFEEASLENQSIEEEPMDDDEKDEMVSPREPTSPKKEKSPSPQRTAEKTEGNDDLEKVLDGGDDGPKKINSKRLKDFNTLSGSRQPSKVGVKSKITHSRRSTAIDVDNIWESAS